MTPTHPERSRKILIADDDEGTVALLSIGLEKEGYEVVSATDGQEALEKAEEHHPDLILLDIMMPKLDGYSLLLRLKGAERTARRGSSAPRPQRQCRFLTGAGKAKAAVGTTPGTVMRRRLSAPSRASASSLRSRSAISRPTLSRTAKSGSTACFRWG